MSTHTEMRDTPSHHSNFCRRCGRKLALKMLDRRYGPHCWSRLRGPVAALQAARNPAASKAAELLLEGGLARLRGHGGRVWRTVSADGSRIYLTAPEACNCAAGLYGKLCHHRVAVIIMLEA